MPSARDVFNTLTEDEKQFILKAIKDVGKETVRQKMEQPNFVETMRKVRAMPLGFSLKGIIND